MILSKLTTFDIIIDVQMVCMLFRKICKQPSMFRSINVDCCGSHDFTISTIRYAVDRSAGDLIDIYLEYAFKTLMYVVDRSSKLKHLRLGSFANVGDKELIDAVKKLPFLEEVQLVFSISSKTIEAIGNLCPSLRSFSLYKDDWRRYDRPSNEDAQAIAKSMPNLHHPQLIGISVSNEGLEAILNGCPLLESLDLHVCFYNNL